MKKIILLLSSLCSLSLIAQQSFYKGALVTDLTAGLEIYSVKERQTNKYNNTDTYKTDGAANSNYSLGAEYGVLNWLGIGLRGKIDNYFTSRDSVTHVKPKANGFEVGAIINFHPLRKKHFDLVGGFNIGYSHLLYDANDGTNDQAYGNGSWFDIHITPRIYFGRFGFSPSIYVPFINYPNLTTNVNNYNQYFLTSWKATGFGINIGLQYRFIKNEN